MERKDKELGVNTLEPRTFHDLRMCCNDMKFNHITVGVFRYRLQFFALNASDEDIKKLSVLW